MYGYQSHEGIFPLLLLQPRTFLFEYEDIKPSSSPFPGQPSSQAGVYCGYSGELGVDLEVDMANGTRARGLVDVPVTRTVAAVQTDDGFGTRLLDDN
jgi:hypothetical protein